MTMLPLPGIGYHRATSLEDAMEALAVPGSRVLAGGTDLLPSMKQGVAAAARLVAVGHLPELQGVRRTPDKLTIGAATRLRDLVTHPDVSRLLPALSTACANVATPTIQEMATLGGNLALDTRCTFLNQPAGWRQALGGCLKCEGTVCHVAPRGKGCYAAHSADTVPVLILAGAEVVVRARAGARRLPLRELYDGADGRSWLRMSKGELLTEVDIPLPVPPIVVRKVRARAALDFGEILVAVQRRDDGLHAVISGVGPAPVEVRAAEPNELVTQALNSVHPLGTHLSSPSWRRRMVAVELRRATAALPR